MDALLLRRHLPPGEEDYWRLEVPLNEDLGLSMNEEIKIRREERQYLLECEIEVQDDS